MNGFHEYSTCRGLSYAPQAGARLYLDMAKRYTTDVTAGYRLQRKREVNYTQVQALIRNTLEKVIFFYFRFFSLFPSSFLLMEQSYDSPNCFTSNIRTKALSGEISLRFAAALMKI